MVLLASLSIWDAFEGHFWSCSAHFPARCNQVAIISDFFLAGSCRFTHGAVVPNLENSNLFKFNVVSSWGRLLTMTSLARCSSLTLQIHWDSTLVWQTYTIDKNKRIKTREDWMKEANALMRHRTHKGHHLTKMLFVYGLFLFLVFLFRLCLRRAHAHR